MNKKTIIFIVLVGIFISAFTTIQVSERNGFPFNSIAMYPDTTVEYVPDSVLAIREADLLTEDWEFDLLSTYSLSAPGTSERYDRAFENAPPMIPHSTVGLVPITKDLNMCITCHMPIIAVAMKSTPIPQSHFTKYRPTVNPEDVVRIEELVYEEDLNGQLDNARYNCTLCHASQATITVEIDNNFMPDFRDDKGNSNSNLHENTGEGVK